MEQFENELKRIFTKDFETPQSYKDAVKKAIKTAQEKKDNDVLKFICKLEKIAAMIILSIASVSGIVYAGVTIYQNVWKEPQKFSIIDELEITEEKKQKCISKEEIKKIALEKLNLLGYNNVKIKDSEIITNPNTGKLFWKISTDNSALALTLYAQSGEIYSFGYNGDIDESSRCTKEQAEEVANSIFKNLGYNEEEYKLTDILENNYGQEKSYYWKATFCKMYDGIKNEYQRVLIDFSAQTSQIVLLNNINIQFENNEVILTKEEAINIAKNKEKELNVLLDTKEITSELKIKCMNEYVYLLEKNLLFRTEEANLNNETVSYNSYQNDDGIRKVWSVKIAYTNNENKDFFREYYVDATTGEIIGGNGIVMTELIK